MSLTVLLIAAAATVGVIALHLLNRGMDRSLPVGTVRFIPLLASRQPRLGALREPLLLALRVLLIIGAAAVLLRALAEDGTSGRNAPANGELISALIDSAGTLPSPAFGAINGATIEVVTIADDAREGLVVAPFVEVGEWRLAPAAVPKIVDVVVLASRERDRDARVVTLALESLGDASGLRLGERCEDSECVAAAAPEIVVALGRPEFRGPPGTVVLHDADEPAGAGAPWPVRLATASHWRWPARFDPVENPVVATAAFPEQLADVLRRIAVQDRRAAGAGEGVDATPMWLAALLGLLWISERMLARGSDGDGKA